MRGNPGKTENDTWTEQTAKLKITASGPGRPKATKIKNNSLKIKQAAQNAATGARLLKWLTTAKSNTATSSDRGTVAPIKDWPQAGTSDGLELSHTELRQAHNPRITTLTDDKDPSVTPESSTK